MNISKKPLVVKLDNFDAISNSIGIAKNEEAITLKPVLFDDVLDAYHLISFGFSGFLLIFGTVVFAYLFCWKNRSSQQSTNITVTSEVPQRRSRFVIPDIELDEM
ncbi:hypothetical protein ACFFRR_005445 [Megaselia abdita]